MNAKTIRWGLIGPGGIAHKFARDLLVVEGAKLVAVSGRDLGRARAFADQYGAEYAYSDEVALAANPEVDAVYISSPHNAHFASALAVLQAGKPVLCEKPLTVNAAQTRQLIEAARAGNLFLMEAVWTRFLPVFDHIRQWLDSGRIGPVRLVSSTFCVKLKNDEERRWYNPALAGGALLDLGIYNLTLNQMILGAEPESFAAQTLFTSTGVDEMTSVLLRYSGNRVAQFTCGLNSISDNALIISGEEGCIRIPSFFHGAQEATLTVGNHSETIRAPFRSGGFEYEIEEAMRCLRTGEVESPRLTHADTLATMILMDAIRTQVGLVYPFEK